MAGNNAGRINNKTMKERKFFGVAYILKNGVVYVRKHGHAPTLAFSTKDFVDFILHNRENSVRCKAPDNEHIACYVLFSGTVTPDETQLEVHARPIEGEDGEIAEGSLAIGLAAHGFKNYRPSTFAQ